MKPNRKNHRAGMAALGLALGLAFCGEIAAQEVINSAAANPKGTYTYYARGNTSVSAGNPTGGVAPFTVPFYPGSDGTEGRMDGNRNWNKDFENSNATAIPFAEGYLTDHQLKQSTVVSGFQGVISWEAQFTGSFDILFDLGSPYHIMSVVVRYGDGSGFRINPAEESQSVWTSANKPSSDADLTLFAKATGKRDIGRDQLNFVGTPAVARYVDVRPSVMALQKKFAPGSAGAYFVDILIYGEPVKSVEKQP